MACWWLVSGSVPDFYLQIKLVLSQILYKSIKSKSAIHGASGIWNLLFVSPNNKKQRKLKHGNKSCTCVSDSTKTSVFCPAPSIAKTESDRTSLRVMEPHWSDVFRYCRFQTPLTSTMKLIWLWDTASRLPLLKCSKV